MPHISKQKINDLVLKRIYKLIFSAVSDRNISKKQQQDAFGELLTHTEKIMLGKRLAAVSMLSQGISPYKTGVILKLSHTTTMKIKTKIENGKFKNTKILCTSLKKGSLQKYIENLFKPLPKYGTSPSGVFRDI